MAAMDAMDAIANIRDTAAMAYANANAKAELLEIFNWEMYKGAAI